MTRLGHGIMALTPQQVRVLMMLSEGLPTRQMASDLGITEETIKAHVSDILQKLDVESRTQAVIAAAKIAGGQSWQQRQASRVEWCSCARIPSVPAGFRLRPISQNWDAHRSRTPTPAPA